MLALSERFHLVGYKDAKTMTCNTFSRSMRFCYKMDDIDQEVAVMQPYDVAHEDQSSGT
jgi:hypothetical protein